MTITVKRKNRFGLNRGWWWISRKQATQLMKDCGLDQPLPRIGHEVCLKTEDGEVRGPRARFPHTYTAWLTNVSGRYQLRDTANLVEWEEVW